MGRRYRQTEADRLRHHNEEMKLALAENVTVLEARRRLVARRWRAFEERLERNRRCGTADAAAPSLISSEPTFAPLAPRAARESLFWWERD